MAAFLVSAVVWPRCFPDAFGRYRVVIRQHAAFAGYVMFWNYLPHPHAYRAQRHICIYRQWVLPKHTRHYVMLFCDRLRGPLSRFACKRQGSYCFATQYGLFCRILQTGAGSHAVSRRIRLCTVVLCIWRRYFMPFRDNPVAYCHDSQAGNGWFPGNDSMIIARSRSDCAAMPSRIPFRRWAHPGCRVGPRSPPADRSESRECSADTRSGSAWSSCVSHNP